MFKDFQILSLSFIIILFSLQDFFEGQEFVEFLHIEMPIVRTLTGIFAAINVAAILFSWGIKFGRKMEERNSDGSL